MNKIFESLLSVNIKICGVLTGDCTGHLGPSEAFTSICQTFWRHIPVTCNLRNRHNQELRCQNCVYKSQRPAVCYREVISSSSAHLCESFHQKLKEFYPLISYMKPELSAIMPNFLLCLYSWLCSKPLLLYVFIVAEILHWSNVRIN